MAVATENRGVLISAKGEVLKALLATEQVM